MSIPYRLILPHAVQTISYLVASCLVAIEADTEIEVEATLLHCTALLCSHIALHVMSTPRVIPIPLPFLIYACVKIVWHSDYVRIRFPSCSCSCSAAPLTTSCLISFDALVTISSSSLSLSASLNTTLSCPSLLLPYPTLPLLPSPHPSSSCSAASPAIHHPSPSWPRVLRCGVGGGHSAVH